MTIYRVSMSYWTYWKDAYNSGYKIKEAFFSTLETAFARAMSTTSWGLPGKDRQTTPSKCPSSTSTRFYWILLNKEVKNHANVYCWIPSLLYLLFRAHSRAGNVRLRFLGPAGAYRVFPYPVRLALEEIKGGKR